MELYQTNGSLIYQTSSGSAASRTLVNPSHLSLEFSLLLITESTWTILDPACPSMRVPWSFEAKATNSMLLNSTSGPPLHGGKMIRSGEEIIAHEKLRAQILYPPLWNGTTGVERCCCSRSSARVSFLGRLYKL